MGIACVGLGCTCTAYAPQHQAATVLSKFVVVCAVGNVFPNIIFPTASCAFSTGRHCALVVATHRNSIGSWTPANNW